MTFAEEAKDWDNTCVLRFADIPQGLWGDETAGFVSDWIYRRSADFIVIMFALPPGGHYVSSEQLATNYSAYECHYVISGSYTIHDPVSGEVQVAKPGEAIVFGPDQWHHGHNFGETELVAIEILIRDSSTTESKSASPTMVGAAKGVDLEALGHWPGRKHGVSNRFTVVREEDVLHALLGAVHSAHIGMYTSGPRISMGFIELAAGRRTETMTHERECVLVVEGGHCHIRVPGEKLAVELGPRDGVVLPGGVPHELLNQRDVPSRVLFGLAGLPFQWHP